ncbi:MULTISPECIES: dioxygenase family protein [Pseudomonas]|uniref:Dioxygenase n=1 Tax=Pseudomonas alloputida TaxID=1940621 RepID=A0ABY3CXZ9_9PSED|nr:class III extradiol ring-cleavage dioxygenase [Pseudomonas alloputida]MCO6692781.1 dioxygenase [Pseudomonas shirazica]TRZ57571.1 dioxygenase [Pseudomonas alloputida]
MCHAYPVLFVSHGAPTFALDPGIAGARLAELGRDLSRPTAILVVSPHWMTRGSVRISSSAAPETIHDFGGFPEALYRLSYPAPGNPDLAERIRGLLSDAGFPAITDPRRGLDHGAWVPLLHLVPAADIPVVQVSLPLPLDPAGAWRFGQAMQPLREAGVLIICSGSLTHNLYEFRGQHGPASDYVTRFADWTADALRKGDLQTLLDYRQNAPEAERAHPSDEHFLPLFVALGAAGSDYELEVLEGGVAYGVLAMDSYLFSTPSQQPFTHETISL